MAGVGGEVVRAFVPDPLPPLPMARSALASLGQVGMIRELTRRRRGRIYSYVKYLEILSEGTEPIA